MTPKVRRLLPRLLMVAAVTVSVLALSFAQGSAAPGLRNVTVLIVRHAEKQLVGNDPQLAYVGNVRALKLAQILEKEEIKHVFSTDYIRTKNTAKPTADKPDASRTWLHYLLFNYSIN